MLPRKHTLCRGCPRAMTISRQELLSIASANVGAQDPYVFQLAYVGERADNPWPAEAASAGSRAGNSPVLK
jgi:hypothetical protein